MWNRKKVLALKRNYWTVIIAQFVTINVIISCGKGYISLIDTSSKLKRSQLCTLNIIIICIGKYEYHNPIWKIYTFHRIPLTGFLYHCIVFWVNYIRPYVKFAY